jgi:NAD(P)-binding Rossmann-like domain
MEEKTPQQPVDRTAMFCIIGAGSSGITAAKNLSETGIPCEVFEREDGIGGNWYYGQWGLEDRQARAIARFISQSDALASGRRTTVAASTTRSPPVTMSKSSITATVRVSTLPPGTSRSRRARSRTGGHADSPAQRCPHRMLAPSGVGGRDAGCRLLVVIRAADHAGRGKGTVDGSS